MITCGVVWAWFTLCFVGGGWRLESDSRYSNLDAGGISTAGALNLPFE